VGARPPDRRRTVPPSAGGPAEDTASPAVPERPDEVRRELDALGVRPSKGWGQSFLTDPFVADAEAALVDVRPGQPVVEIGGGLGILTAALVRRDVRPLTVVERDPRLAAHLRRVFGARIEVMEGDALTAPLPPSEAVVGNLPYSVATPILLAQFARRIPRVVFLVQEEVAQRLAAGPGSRVYGRLSIAARLYGTVELFRPVPPGAFTPIPAVASRLGIHRARSDPLPVPSVPEFESLVRTLFSARRKQLGNLLPRAAPSEAAADRWAAAAGWPEGWQRLRPEQLAPEAYFALARSRPRTRRGAQR
jgi:16S rRNA (adenine1518-N6/adenine1519-N6)-dimethyltransferase